MIADRHVAHSWTSICLDDDRLELERASYHGSSEIHCHSTGSHTNPSDSVVGFSSSFWCGPFVHEVREILLPRLRRLVLPAVDHCTDVEEGACDHIAGNVVHRTHPCIADAFPGTDRAGGVHQDS